MFEDTTWAILTGEQWAVVGANGSGKSVLLRAICGEIPVIAGEIIYHFADPMTRDGYMDYAHPPENDVAYVSLELHRDTVRRAMAYHQARWASFDQEAAPTVRDVLGDASAGLLPPAFAALTTALGIPSLLDRKIVHLSNGEMRKLLITRALAQSPRVLILDNPFAGLDARSRRVLMRAVDALMADGLPVILAVQRRDEIPARVTHVLCVDGARVVSSGPKRFVLRQEACLRALDASSNAAAPAALPRAIPPTRDQAGHPETLIEIRRAGVAYDGTTILDVVDWTVCMGERWAVIGPNGSGKSTLLSLILGDNPQAYANHIRVFGTLRGKSGSIWDIKRRIGWMAPELQFHYDGDVDALDVTCSGFFDSIGVYRRCTETQRRVAHRWMQRLGLTSQAGAPFGALSDGQQRMVLLARALVKNPPLLILDEPCQGLDAANRRRVLMAVDEAIAHTDGTLIYVTHHPDEAPACITHELRLRRGRVTRSGAIGRGSA